MTNIYIRNIPRDLKKRLDQLKKDLDCTTWVTFMYEVVGRIEKQLKEQARKEREERGY